MTLRAGLAGLVVLGLLVARSPVRAADEARPKPGGAPRGKVVASCDFEGPYRKGKHQIHDGLRNNWSWGRKDMVFAADQDSGRPGTVQSIHLRGITSGAMQLFYTRVRLKKDHYYRVSFWMKAEGLEGRLRVIVRKIGGPWTPYVGGWTGWTGIPGPEWKQYSFSGKCAVDVDRDLGVMFETAAMGKMWLDDLLVEEFTEDPAAAEQEAARKEVVKGNLLPRSSCEGRRDYFWSGGVYGRDRTAAEWEDPQPCRAEGGKFGKYCMAIPPSTKGEGRVFCRSAWVDVVPDQKYTFSVWLKSDRPNCRASMELLRKESQRGIAHRGVKLSPDWTRHSITGVATASGTVYLGLGLGPNSGTLYADAFQLEAGDTPTPYEPKHPLELYADIAQKSGGNLLEWGEKIPLRLFAAAAADAADETVKVKVRITGYPDRVVWRKTWALPVGEEKVLNLDLKQGGLFRAEIRAVEKDKAAPQEMLFALLPPPRPTGKESCFGTHITVRPFFIDYARRIGMKWTRFHDACIATKWSEGEPARGQYRWYDTQVDAVRKAGLRILGLPDRPPKWARIKPGEAENVIDLEAFGKYCENLARHYRGRIDHWEVWNEPYIKYFFDGTPEQYGPILQVAYKALKEGNPDAKVLGFCTEMSGLGYARKIPALAHKCIDILSFHLYPNNLTGGGTLPFASEIEEYRKLLGENDPGEYWNSEGANGSVGGNSFYSFLPVTRELNDRAVAFASRVWIEHAKAGMTKFFVYTVHQSDSIMYYGGLKMLIGFDRSVTPAAVATATTAWCMDGMRSVPCDKTPGVVQGLFQGNGRSAWAVYDDSGVAGSMKLHLRKVPSTVRILDVMGNDPRKDGRKKWTIGLAPLFLVSKSMNAEKLAQIGQGAIGGASQAKGD